MVALCSFETSVNFNQSTERHMPRKWNFGVCMYGFFCWHQISIINLLCMHMFLTCMHFFFCIVAVTERSHMRRTWYICCRLPCPSSSVFTELPIHAVNFVRFCYCDCLIKNSLVILSSLMTLLVCARAFTFLSSLDITNRPTRCLEREQEKINLQF
jgi:hypothetical protein